MNVPDDVLHEVNQLRERFGLPPIEAMPCGLTGRNDECPVARCLPDDWNVSSAVAYPRMEMFEKDIDLPWPVRRFIRDFDAGLYPELVES